MFMKVGVGAGKKHLINDLLRLKLHGGLCCGTRDKQKLWATLFGRALKVQLKATLNYVFRCHSTFCSMPV